MVQNPWYVIEYTDEDTYCAGKFMYNDDLSLQVDYVDDGEKKIFNGTYSIDENGSVTIVHHGKRDVDTIMSNEDGVLTIETKAYDEDTGEFLHTMDNKYFANYDDMIDFGNLRGVDCSQEIPK